MKKIDYNRAYRSMAIYTLVKGCKNDGRFVIPWNELQDKFGLQWETLSHELTVKGIINNTLGGVYISDEWRNKTRAEAMADVSKVYPYRWNV